MPAAALLYSEALSLPAGSRLAIFNAADDPELSALTGFQVQCMQNFKPMAERLHRHGLVPSSTLQACDHSLILPSKNKLQTCGWMAEAIQALPSGGHLIMAAANDHGARSYEKLMRQLGGHVQTRSASKCRIFSTVKSSDTHLHLAEQWQTAAAPRRLNSHGLISMPGLFSWDKPDAGSSLLLEQLPPLKGEGMDLCAGYGLLSVNILRNHPGVSRVQLVEAELLALQCAGRNTEAWADRVQIHWLDAAQETLPGQLDWVVCNPPFHEGHGRDVALGQAIAARGCQSLRRGGELWLVANRQLPYEKILQNQLTRIDIVTQAQGYKIIRGIR